MRSKRKKQAVNPAAKRIKRQRLHDLRACYVGCMLGITLMVVRFRAYARKYPLHRQRISECFTELGVNVILPLKHKDFVARHDAIMEAVQAELARVSQEHLGWALFGSAIVEFGAKHGTRLPEARTVRRALAVFMDKLQLPPALLTRFARACRPEKDGTLSLYALHSAALAMLNQILAGMPRATRTSFVAMPFTNPRIAGRYTGLYVPLLNNLELKPLRAWGSFGTEEYQDLLYTLIDRCGLMLADLTTINPNVMHELGYALGKGDKFVVLVAEKGEPVPSNVGDLTVLTYDAKGRDWQAKAAGEIAAAVALYQYAASLDALGGRSGRIVGPLKVTA